MSFWRHRFDQNTDGLGILKTRLDSKFFLFLGHHDCEECGQTFSGPNAKRSLNRHIKSEHETPEVKMPKSHICEFCNKDYNFKSNLRTHLKTCKFRKKNIKSKGYSNKPNKKRRKKETDVRIKSEDEDYEEEEEMDEDYF